MAAFQSTPWRLISGVLGVTCLVLMATLGILLKNALTKQSVQPTPSPGPTMEPQKGSGGYFCQEKWIGYQCKCYFISNEKKTWAESRNFCASQNSTLLQLENRDELQQFIKYIRNFYWIGLSYSGQHHAWLWEDGSAFSKDLFEFTERNSAGNCMVYNAFKRGFGEPCTDENYYICKQRLI
ncbi:natural killer cells antigen CD94 [Myotis daubentonii]|uniref:natural killer cells antigen CD94 n=1 Tax=Myotis daubentonii TaxID=98922 RepID=UPI002873F257|nr:natural killer cells antigen CD94 [Myotis daubentonii]